MYTLSNVFQKLRVGFSLDKFSFLKERLDFFHNLIANGNYPTASKFDMTKMEPTVDWVKLTLVCRFSYIYNRYIYVNKNQIAMSNIEALL